MAAILSAPPRTKIGLRDHTILITLYDSAMRLEELLSVKLNDMNFEGEYPCILLHGKGNKERFTPLTEKAVGHLKKYLRIFHSNYDGEANSSMQEYFTAVRMNSYSDGCFYFERWWILIMWNCELFEADISKYTYVELAEWIIGCRNIVLKSNYDTVKEYQYYVFAFCREWEEHYDQNRKIYKSSKYKKAILFIGRKDKFEFLVDYGNGSEDVTDAIYSNMQSSILKKYGDEIAFETLNDDIYLSNKKLKECFSDSENFKDRLEEFICKFYFSITCYYSSTCGNYKLLND